MADEQEEEDDPLTGKGNGVVISFAMIGKRKGNENERIIAFGMISSEGREQKQGPSPYAAAADHGLTAQRTKPTVCSVLCRLFPCP